MVSSVSLSSALSISNTNNAGQRKGTMRQHRRLSEHDKRLKLLNLVLYAREKRKGIPDRCSRFLKRYLIIKNQYKKQLQKLHTQN